MKKSKPDNTRTVQITCWLRDEEHMLLKEATSQANCSLSHLLRRSAINNAEKILGRRIVP
jgi:uncharacterized protein (DUF1778 family)